jgi:hypothetical protein
MMASTGGATTSGPTATLTARAPSTAPATSVPAMASAPVTYGGTIMNNDPPAQSSSPNSRYR